jgi:hypothetical protein
VSIESFVEAIYESALAAATEVPSVTDQDLTRRIPMIQAQIHLEIAAKELILNQSRLTEDQMRRRSDSKQAKSYSKFRILFDKHDHKLKKLGIRLELLTDALHSRMCLRDSEGVVPWLVERGYFERVGNMGFHISAERAVEGFSKYFPES